MSSKSITQQRWEQGQCRIEEGVFFGDGRVLLLVGDLTHEKRKETHIDTLVETSPDAWAEIDTAVECISSEHGLRILAGGGAWEGEGFVAACRLSDDQLVWLIHLESSEAFNELEIQDGGITAVSEEYPIRNEWVIPINSPEKIRKVY